MKFPLEVNDKLKEDLKVDVNMLLDNLEAGARIIRNEPDKSLEFIQILHGNKNLLLEFRKLISAIEMAHDVTLFSILNVKDESNE